MKTLNGKILDEFQLKDSLNRIVDVMNFEGPLLTLYENMDNKHLYLLDWVDRDSTSNRWLIYRCNLVTLDKFIKGEISHKELFLSDENYCYVVDIDKNFAWDNPQRIIKQNLPLTYIPVEDAFFEESDCPNFRKLQDFMNERKTSLVPKYSEPIKDVRKVKIPVFTYDLLRNKFSISTKFDNLLNHKSKNIYQNHVQSNH